MSIAEALKYKGMMPSVWTSSMRNNPLIRIDGIEIEEQPESQHKNVKEDKDYEERKTKYAEEQARIKDEEDKKKVEYEKEQARIREEAQKLIEEQQALEESYRANYDARMAEVAAHRKFIDDQAKETGGPGYDALADKYQATMNSEMFWSTNKFAECQEDLLESQEKWNKEMNEFSKDTATRIRDEWESKELGLELSHQKEKTKINCQVFDTQSSFAKKIKEASEEDEKERLKEEMDANLRALNERKSAAAREYNETTEEWSKQKKKDLAETRACGEMFDQLSSGMDAFDSDEDANRTAREQRQNLFHSHHTLAVQGTQLEKLEEGINQRKSELAHLRSETKKQMSELRKKSSKIQYNVMAAQIDSQKDPEKRKEILTSVQKEIDQDIAAHKKAISHAKATLEDEVYDLTQDRKTVMEEADSDKKAYHKREQRYQKRIGEIESSLKHASALSRPKLERELKEAKDGLVQAQSKAEEVDKQLSEKLSGIDQRHLDARSEAKLRVDELIEMSTDLEESKVNLTKLAGGVKRESTDVVPDLSLSLDSVTLGDEDDYEDMETSPATVRRVGHKRPRLSSSPIKSKYRKTKGTSKKRNIENPSVATLTGVMTKGNIKNLMALHEEGGKNLSSVARPNKVVPGSTYIYNANSVDELRETDNALWGKISHSTTHAQPELGIGKGNRRQWYGKKDKNLTKVAVHYEGTDLGVVRYYYVKEPEMKDIPEAKQVETASITTETVTTHVMARRDVNAGEKEKFSAKIAAPQIQDRDLVLDHDVLETMFQETPSDELLDPGTDMIKEPKGGDLYLYSLQPGKLKEADYLKEDGYSWKKTYESSTKQFSTVTYNARVGNSTSKAFKRINYRSQDGTAAAVHYIGDEGVATAKEGRYARPQVYDRIVEEGEAYGLEKRRTIDVYRDLKSKTDAEGVAKDMADPASVASTRWHVNKQKKKFSKEIDDLENLRNTANMLADENAYVRNVNDWPSTQVVVSDHKALKSLNAGLEAMPDTDVLEVHYDTTFSMSGHYLSTISVRHPTIEKKTANPNSRETGAIIPICSQVWTLPNTLHLKNVQS